MIQNCYWGSRRQMLSLALQQVTWAPRALSAPGLLHQLHNTMHDVCADLPSFSSWFKEPFRALCTWLRNVDNRELFKGVCMTSAMALPIARSIGLIPRQSCRVAVGLCD